MLDKMINVAIQVLPRSAKIETRYNQDVLIEDKMNKYE